MTAGGRGRSLQTAQRFEAVDAGEPDVEEHDFDIASGGALQRFFGGGGGFDVVSLVHKNRGERFADPGFIIDNEQMRTNGHQVASTPLRSATVAV